MKLKPILVLAVVILSTSFGFSALAQDDIPPKGFGIGNPPDVPESESLVAFAERTNLENNEKLILRTIHFMVSETSIEEYQTSMGEMIPEQAKSLNHEFEAFQEKSEEIRSRTESLVADYEKKRGRSATPREVKTIVGKEIKKIEVEFYANVTNELLRHQKLAIANWRPESRGISKTLTETPIGKTIGLTEMQLEEIRERSDEIGAEFHEAYKKARTEVLELYEDVLTKEQAKKVKDLYYPGSSVDMPFVPMSPVEIFRLEYKKDTTNDK